MPRGFRLILVVFAGLLISATQHPNVTAQPKQASAQERSAQALENIAARYDEQTKRAERSPHDQQCEPTNDQRNSDLCAQWKAADAAADTARWTAIGTGISFLSGLLVLGAVYLAFKSNWIARTTAKHQLRAYVASGGIDLRKFAKGGVEYWSVEHNWKNNGQTPALSVTSNTNWKSLPDGIPDDFEFPDQSEIGNHCPAPLGPNQGFGSNGPDMEEGLIREVRQKKTRVFIWGWAEYRDIFAVRKRRRTEFCLELLILPQDGTQSFVYAPFGPHNGMDGDCMKKPQSS